MKSALTVVLFRLFTIGVFVDGNEESVSVTKGDSVTLKSGVTEIQTDDGIEWRFNVIRIAKISRDSNEIWVKPDGPFRDRLQLDSQTGDLKISNISTTDSGQYKLKISSRSGSSEMTFSVKVVPAVVSADEVKSVSVMEGDSVTLHTDPTDIQRDAVIQWRYDKQKSLVAEINRKAGIFNTYDGPDERFRDRLQLDQTGSLNITNTRTTDSGDYEVEIISTSSSYTTHHTQSFTVTVRDDVQSVSVMKRDSVTLHTGLTKMQTDDQIVWKFGDRGELIADLNGPVNKTRSNFSLNNQTGDLNISNIQRDQSGLYKVEIITRRMILHRKYQITMIDAVKSVSVKEGETVTLPITEIQNDDLIVWMFGNIRLAEIHKADQRFFTYDGPDERFRDRLKLDHQTGSLNITDTRTTDFGLYEVKISSSRRTINRRITVNVTATYKIAVTSHIPHGTASSSNNYPDAVKSVSVREGKTVTLPITEIQNDDLIMWMFGNIRLAEIHKADQRFYISDVPDKSFRDRLNLDHQTGSLNITDTRTTDSGLYEVKISSSRRTINSRFIVTVTATYKIAVTSSNNYSAVPESGWSSAAVAGIGVVGFLLGAAAVVIYYRCKRSRDERRKNEPQLLGEYEDATGHHVNMEELRENESSPSNEYVDGEELRKNEPQQYNSAGSGPENIQEQNLTDSTYSDHFYE